VFAPQRLAGQRLQLWLHLIQQRHDQAGRRQQLAPRMDEAKAPGSAWRH
jgi:hypothetical protein